MNSYTTQKTQLRPTHKLNPQKEASGFWQTAQVNARQRSQFPGIKSSPRPESIPLSLNQERLWMIEQLHTEASVHNLLHIVRFKGLLKVSVLQQSLEAIVQRHEILRTSFSASPGTSPGTSPGKPAQVVAANISCSLSLIDCRSVPAEKWESEAIQIGRADAEKPFDLSQVPLWRFTLLRFSDDFHVLIRSIHHIAFDGWSHNVFMRELGIFYKAFSEEFATPLLELPIQYIDFAQAQRQWLQSSAFESQLNYWKEKFAQGISPIQLPTHAPTASCPIYKGSHQPIVLSQALTETIKALSYQEGVSVFVVLLTAFKVLLHRYREQEQMLVCSPVAGRQRSETRGLIGYFNNIVTLQTDLSADPSFRELLARVSQVTLEAYANQDVPLQEVAKLPGVAQTPLTRAMFVLQNTPNPSIKLPELEIQSQYIERDVADFDLALSLQEEAKRLIGTLRYRVALFETETVQQMAENFQDLVEKLVANPDQRLSELPSFTVEVAERSSAQSCDQLEGANTFVAPSTALENQLAQIWESLLKVKPISVHSNFFELGGHSLLAIELFAQIEQQLRCNLPLASLFQSPTIAQLAQRIEQGDGEAFQGNRTTETTELKSLVQIQAGNKATHPPLFLIAPGASTVLQYAELARLLGADQPVYSLQAPDFENQDISLDSLEAIAAFYLKEIATLDYDGAYLLGGRCALGAAVALEMALQLQEQSKQVPLLVMLDPSYEAFRKALEPQQPQRNSPLYYLSRLSYHWQRRELQPMLLRRFPFLKAVLREPAKQAEQRFSQPSSPESDSLDSLPSEEFAGDLAKLTDPLQRERLTQLFKKQRNSLRRYRPRAVYQGEIVLFLTEYRKQFGLVRYKDWNKLATKGIKIHLFPGHHNSLLRKPVVEMVAAKLREHS
jgi:thioesterase domain-containing protein/acyl carrier protein